MNLLTKQEIEALLAGVSRPEPGQLDYCAIADAAPDLARTALDALARLKDAEAAQALVIEQAAEMDPVAAPDTAAICGALLSLPAVYAHQINTGVRDVYDPLQRFFRMEDVLRALIPKRTADDRA